MDDKEIFEKSRITQIDRLILDLENLKQEHTMFLADKEYYKEKIDKIFQTFEFGQEFIK